MPLGPPRFAASGTADCACTFSRLCYSLRRMPTFWLLAIGLVAGVFSGVFGIGGGLVIVPALLYVMKMETREATGTSLAALIPPVGLLGALEYYRNGFINIRYAALIALGLFIGAYFGAKVAVALPQITLRRLYGVFMLLISVKLLFDSK